MAFTTPKMSLKVWNSETDSYDHEQLADNFLKLDQHNHGPGQGVQIGASGLAANAVTGDKIAPHSIGATQIIDNSIMSTQIQNGTIQLVDLSPQVLPPGVMWSYSGGVLPTGWLWCRGQEELIATYPTLAALLGATYGAASAGYFKVPNLQEKFPMGAGGAHSLGASGGSFTHNHSVPNHRHGISSLSVSAGLGLTGSAGSQDSNHNHMAPYYGTGAFGVHKGFVSSIAGESPHPGDGGPYALALGDAGSGSIGIAISEGTQNETTPHYHPLASNGADAAVTGGPSLSGYVGDGGADANSGLVTGSPSAEQPFTVVNYIIKT